MGCPSVWQVMKVLQVWTFQPLIAGNSFLIRNHDPVLPFTHQASWESKNDPKMFSLSLLSFWTSLGALSPSMITAVSPNWDHHKPWEPWESLPYQILQLIHHSIHQLNICLNEFSHAERFGPQKRQCREPKHQRSEGQRCAVAEARWSADDGFESLVEVIDNQMIAGWF